MRYFILLAVIALLFVACNKDDHVTSPPTFSDTTISLKHLQTAEIPGTGQSLRFDAVLYDGRLPHDSVVPYWFTNTAQLQFTLLPSGAKIQLHISGEVTDSSGVHFNSASVLKGELSYRLAALTPLPTTLMTPVADSELLATVEIRTATKPHHDSCSFPLALGNRWIYLDSSFVGDSLTSVSLDTITIADEYTDQNGQWWTFSKWFFPYGWTTMGRSDTLFSQQVGDGPLDPGHPLYFVGMEFAPPVGDSSNYRFIVEGDMMYVRTVTRLASAFVTPAGSFEHGLRYSAMVTYVHATEVFVPGVGFVYMENVAEFDNGQPWHTNRMWLTGYRLK